MKWTEQQTYALSVPIAPSAPHCPPDKVQTPSQAFEASRYPLSPHFPKQALSSVRGPPHSLSPVQPGPPDVVPASSPFTVQSPFISGSPPCAHGCGHGRGCVDWWWEWHKWRKMSPLRGGRRRGSGRGERGQACVPFQLSPCPTCPHGTALALHNLWSCRARSLAESAEGTLKEGPRLRVQSRGDGGWAKGKRCVHLCPVPAGPSSWRG